MQNVQNVEENHKKCVLDVQPDSWEQVLGYGIDKLTLGTAVGSFSVLITGTHQPTEPTSQSPGNMEIWKHTYYM